MGSVSGVTAVMGARFTFNLTVISDFTMFAPNKAQKHEKSYY